MKVYGWDTETYLILPGLASPKLVCGSWANETREKVTLPDETRELFVFHLNRGDHLAGVNIAYDIVVMAAMWPDLLPLVFKAGNQGQFHCCAIREALHDIAINKLFIDYKTGRSFGKSDLGGRYSMAVLMDRHFNVDISSEKTGDVWRYKYAQLDGIPLEQWPAEAVSYPKSDARRSLDIYNAQQSHQNLHDEPAQVRAAIALQLMAAWGFRTDGEYIADLEKRVDATWVKAREEFSKAGIYKQVKGVWKKDTAVLKKLVVEAYKGKPPKTTKGDVSTDRDTLEDSGNEMLAKLGSGGKNDKYKTVYIPALKEGIHRPVTPQFNVLVNTGRVSSDWQQMPQKGGIREAIVARPGMVLFSCDLAGAELRTMCQRAINDPDVGYSKMAEYLNSGKDVHSYVGSIFTGISYDDFVARKDELKAFRDVAKILNFGEGGGAGAATIAFGAKVKENIRICLSLKQAKVCGEHTEEVWVQGKLKRVCSVCISTTRMLLRRWFQAWPEQQALKDKAARLTTNGRKTTSITLGSNRIRGGCGFSQWLNSSFQAAVGDGVKAAMWAIDEESYTDRRSPLWGTHPFLNVHDEIFGEVPDDSRLHDASFRVAEILCLKLDQVTPDVKNEVEPAVMRRAFKAAKLALNSQKRLRPWWPSPWTWGPDQAQMCADLAS